MPTSTPDELYFELLTTNAQEWANYFDSVPSEYDSTDVYSLALSKTIDIMMDILQKSLVEAINKAGIEDNEFQRPLLKDKLLQIFGNYDIIKVAQGRVIFDAQTVAGDWNDFWDGVEAARSVFPQGQSLSPQQKANFWRYAVYPTYNASSGIGEDIGDFEEDEEDYWSQTIALRQQSWKDKAPYWLILEHGNAENKLAYPHNEPSNFVYKAEQTAQAVFDSAVESIELQASNLLEEAAQRFVDSPDSFQEYDVLDNFFAEGRRYYIYITSTRRVGVALESTYSGLRSIYG